MRTPAKRARSVGTHRSIGIALTGMLILLGVVIYRIQTSHGTVTVELDDRRCGSPAP